MSGLECRSADELEVEDDEYEEDKDDDDGGGHDALLVHPTSPCTHDGRERDSGNQSLLSTRMNAEGGAPSDHLLERARRTVDGGICALQLEVGGARVTVMAMSAHSSQPG